MANATTYTYDALNRRITMTDAVGDLTQYQYDTGTLAAVLEEVRAEASELQAGLAITLDDLAGDGSGLQTEPYADLLFVFRREMGESADGAGKLAHTHLFGGAFEAGNVAFDLGEPERYHKDVPKAEVHILDAGHFALDTAADEIAALVRDFLGSSR